MEPEYKMIDGRLQPCWEFKNTNIVKQENIQYKQIKNNLDLTFDYSYGIFMWTILDKCKF